MLSRDHGGEKYVWRTGVSRLVYNGEHLVLSRLAGGGAFEKLGLAVSV